MTPTENQDTEHAHLIDYSEVARRLKLPISTVRSMVARRMIPFVRLGPRTVRFNPAVLENWLMRRSEG